LLIRSSGGTFAESPSRKKLEKSLCRGSPRQLLDGCHAAS